LGSPIYSVLQECNVRPGDRVKAGQVLGRLQDGEVRAEAALREAEASSDVDVRLAESRSALASAKLQRTASLLRRNASSQEEYLQHKQEAATAALEIELARHRRKLAAFQLQFSKAVLGTRSLVSPHEGVVTAVLRRAGESVAPRDPIFQVVDPSEVRVVCQVDVSDGWRLRVGQPARVIVEVAGADLEIEKTVFPGVVSFIDAGFDPTTRTCKVFVRANNSAGALRAGLEARVEIDPEPGAPASPQLKDAP
jgi:RND family efflux transporter MFP subunit